jgi:hypothetical protein
MHNPLHTDRQKNVARPKKVMNRSALTRTEQTWMAYILLLLFSILLAECFDLRDGCWTVCYITNFELDNGIVLRNI